MMKRANILKGVGALCYLLFLLYSYLFEFDPGKEIGQSIISFAVQIIKIVPCAFILIGLFEVWIKKETVEKHLGEESGLKGYMWAVLLAGMTMGGLFVACPVAYSLHRKQAKLGVIFTYLGSAAVCRIPMTIYEASFLGIKFTMIRLLVSMPLIIFSSIMLGEYLTKRQYRITNGKQ